MGACHSDLPWGHGDSGDEAAGPPRQARPRDRLEGSEMVQEEICRIMRELRSVERQMPRCRPDLAVRLNIIIEQLGKLETEIEFFESESE